MTYFGSTTPEIPKHFVAPNYMAFLLGLDRPFLFNIAIFVAGLGYTKYLDYNYGGNNFGKSLQNVPGGQKVAFFTFSALLMGLYLAQFTYIIYDSIYRPKRTKANIFNWVAQMFIGNIITFGFIALAMGLLFPDEFYDEDDFKEPRTFLDHFVGMMYYSVSTSFTLGNGDIVPNHKMSRILAIVQIITGFVIRSYLIAVLLFGRG